MAPEEFLKRSRVPPPKTANAPAVVFSEAINAPEKLKVVEYFTAENAPMY